MVKSHTKYMVYQPDTGNYEGRTIGGGLVVVDRDTYDAVQDDLHIREQSISLVDDPNWWVIWRSDLLYDVPASFFAPSHIAIIVRRPLLSAGAAIALALCAVPVLLLLAAVFH